MEGKHSEEINEESFLEVVSGDFSRISDLVSFFVIEGSSGIKDDIYKVEENVGNFDEVKQFVRCDVSFR